MQIFLRLKKQRSRQQQQRQKQKLEPPNYSLTQFKHAMCPQSATYIFFKASWHNLHDNDFGAFEEKMVSLIFFV
eukprot:jgi/Psemu1/306446/fgenesh1_kg.258_\